MAFALEFVTKLDGKLSEEDLKMVCMELEVFCTNYDISQRITDIVVTDYFPEFYKMYFISKKMKGCSNGTLEQYKLQLDYFFETMKKHVNDITTEDITLYLFLLQTQGRPGRKPMSPGVVDGVRRVLNSFFSWAVNNGYMENNPVAAIDKIKGEKKKRKPLSESEVEQVRYTIDNYRRGSKGYKRNLDIRNMALFEVMYSTGARVSEITNLNISDVNFETKEVHLFGKGKKHRVSYLNSKADLYLKEYLKTRSDDNPSLFVNYKAPHNRMSSDGIRRVLKNSGAEAGIDRLYPHRIRHTTATHSLNRGMRLEELQKLLGHEKPETTLIYAQLAQENVKNSHNKFVI